MKTYHATLFDFFKTLIYCIHLQLFREECCSIMWNGAQYFSLFGGEIGLRHGKENRIKIKIARMERLNMIKYESLFMIHKIQSSNQATNGWNIIFFLLAAGCLNHTPFKGHSRYSGLVAYAIPFNPSHCSLTSRYPLNPPPNPPLT